MNLTECLATIMIFLAITYGLISLIDNVGVWRSPCVNVYNNNELIYTGTSWYIRTETRGAATYYRQIQQKKWFPKIEKEIVSDKITIETIKCEK